MDSPEPRIFYSIIDRIIAGLDWVHQQYKIIHRDIKPSNILLDSADIPYISDWGIGKVALQSEKPRSEKLARPQATAANPSDMFTRTGRIGYYPILLARADSEFYGSRFSFRHVQPRVSDVPVGNWDSTVLGQQVGRNCTESIWKALCHKLEEFFAGLNLVLSR